MRHDDLPVGLRDEEIPAALRETFTLGYELWIGQQWLERGELDPGVAEIAERGMLRHVRIEGTSAHPAVSDTDTNERYEAEEQKAYQRQCGERVVTDIEYSSGWHRKWPAEPRPTLVRMALLDGHSKRPSQDTAGYWVGGLIDPDGNLAGEATLETGRSVEEMQLIDGTGTAQSVLNWMVEAGLEGHRNDEAEQKAYESGEIA